MLLSEYYAWVKYRNLRGSLSVTRRLEQSIAQLTAMVGNSGGGKKDGTQFSASDFMPHEKHAEEVAAAEDGSFASFLSTLK